MPRHPARAAMTLTEIVIALAIFMTVMVMVTEGSIGTKSTFDLQIAQDEIAREADQVVRAIRADLVQSGWHIPSDQVEGSTNKLTTSAATDRLRGYYPYIQQQAPDNLFTSPTLGAGLGGQWYYDPLKTPILNPKRSWKHTWRASDLVDLRLPAELVPGVVNDVRTQFGAAAAAAYLASPHARSQEIIFLKANLGDWIALPWQRPSTNSSPLNFAGLTADWQTGNIGATPPGGKQAVLGVLFTSAYKETAAGSGVFVPRVDANADGVPDAPYGTILSSGMVDEVNDNSIVPNWETITAPDYGFRADDTFHGVDDGTTTDPGSPATARPFNLREYMFAVVPSRFGLGRLVRAVRMPAAVAYPIGTDLGQRIALDAVSGHGMVVDRVLSDNVVRVLFDTYRTTLDDAATTTAVEQLGVNQVRVRIFFARRIQTAGNTIVQRVLQTVISMRAKQSDAWVQKDQDLLGANGLAFPY